MLLSASAFRESGYSGVCMPTALHEVGHEDWDTADVLSACLECSPTLRRQAGMRYPEETPQAAEVLGIDIQWARKLLRPTLAQFTRSEPDGVFIVLTHDHALVIRDGMVIDPNWGGRRAMRRRLIFVGRVLNPGPQKYKAASRK